MGCVGRDFRVLGVECPAVAQRLRLRASPQESWGSIPVQVELRGVVDVGIEVQLLRRSRSSPLRAGEDSTPEGSGLTGPPSRAVEIAPPTTTTSDLGTGPLQRFHSTQVRPVYSGVRRLC